MGKKRISFYTNSELARSRTTGAEIDAPISRTDVPGRRIPPIESGVSATHSLENGRIIEEIVVKESPGHRTYICSFMGTGGVRWLAGCSCGWAAPTSRRAAQSARSSAVDHIRVSRSSSPTAPRAPKAERARRFQQEYVVTEPGDAHDFHEVEIGDSAD